jgi:outer membrane protein OmpA-like peptidoglycan-associated protein
MRTSIRTLFVACLLFGLSAPFAAAQDHEGCTDHPLFNRMPNYDIYRCATVAFDAVDFAKPGLKQWDTDKPEDYESIEGKVFSISYTLKDGATPPSALQVIRNFQNAVKAAGGTVLGDFVNPFAAPVSNTMLKFMVDSPGGTSYNRYTNLKLTKGNTEYWVSVAVSQDYNDYNMIVVERQAMAQDVSINELVDKLNNDGFITLYINFDTNSSTIKPESYKTLDDAASVLKIASNLSILVGGHTDNVGSPEANMRLSEERAKAVMAALVQRGIAADRLTAKGFGQTQPIADNRLEDGRAKNRRVELVKQ